MSDSAKSADPTKKPNPARDIEGAKSKKDRTAQSKAVANDPATQEAVARVLNGELGLEEAQQEFPEILTILQETVGNEFVDLLVKGGTKKQAEAAKDETSKPAEVDSKKKAPTGPAELKQEAELKAAALAIGIVGAKMGIGHLLKNKRAKEAADPTKQEAEEKTAAAAGKKPEVDQGPGGASQDPAAEQRDSAKQVDDLQKTDAVDEKDKKDASSSQSSKDKSDLVKSQAKEALSKDAAEPVAEKKGAGGGPPGGHQGGPQRGPHAAGGGAAAGPVDEKQGAGDGPAGGPQGGPQAAGGGAAAGPVADKKGTGGGPAGGPQGGPQAAGGGAGAGPVGEKRGAGGGPARGPQGGPQAAGGGAAAGPVDETKGAGAEPGGAGAEPAAEKKGAGGGAAAGPVAETKGAGAEPGGAAAGPVAETKGAAVENQVTPGGGEADVPTRAPEPVAPAPQSTGPGGTMDAYMAGNPDPQARGRVTNLGFVTDKMERSSKELGGKVELPPDKAWYDAVSPRQDWFAMQQKFKNNPWSGQDKVLAFMHSFNAGLDFVSSAVSKIGLACTVGGVILTFLVPPVGAFLLTVGRVANAISLILSGLKLVISIVQTIMLAVKAAKEKDPLKRMEMMQQMKSSLQSGVMAGIDLILSKVGGGAKGAASSAGSKAMDATKAAFKEAKAAGKGLVRAGGAALKAGGGAFVKGMGTAMKEGFKGMKNSAKEGLKTFAKNPLKTIGGGIKSGLKSAKEGIVKPFGELKTACQGFSSVGKSWKQFWGGRAKNGYFKTVGQMNFKNAMGGKSFKDKLKGAYKDVTDKSAGGVATQIDMFMNGKSDANKGKNNKQEVENHAREAKQKQQELQAALSGNVTQQRQYLAKQDDKQYKDLRHLDDSTIKVMMKQKQKDLAKTQSFGAQLPGFSQGIDLARGVYQTAKGDKDAGDLLKTGLESSQSPALGTAAEFMVNSTSVGDDKKEKKSWVQEAAELNEKRSAKAVEGVQTQLQKSAKGGLTEAKCKSAMSPALAVMARREAELQGLMAQSQTKSAGLMSGGEAKAPEVQGPPPPPPAPPEGTVVPEESLLVEITAQKTRLSGIKAGVQKSIDRAREQREQAIKGDATLTQYAAGLDKQQADVTQQESEAVKDQADITKAKSTIAEGGKQITDKKGVADGEKGKAAAKSAEGGSLSVVPDKAKQQAEEKARAEKERKEEEEKDKKRWAITKAVRRVAKAIGNFLASAAKWVWEKMIAPAIAAVKKAIASVMNAITNLLMSGIIKIIGAIMGKEAENNLNATFAQMKEMEAAQAKAAATETKGKNQEAKLKLTKAQQAAKAKVDTCQANIEEGTALIGEIDGHTAALDAEEQKVVADRETFRAQYSPYFDWVKINEEWQAKNGDKDGKKGPAAPGGEKASGGAANAGPPGAEAEHPADRPLEGTISQALCSAGEIIKTESQESQAAVVGGATEKADAVKAAARGAYDANMADLKAASDKEKSRDMSDAYGAENDRVSRANANADQVVAAVSSAHGKAESERRGRIDALIARASALSGKKASEGLAEARTIWRLISEEAKGIEPAQEQALQDAVAGFDKMKVG